MVNKNNFLQYEVWKDCRNGCEFCFNRGQKDLDKIESLNFILERLQDDEELSNYNELGFIGGEFFDNQLQNPEVQKLFYQIFEKCIQLIKENRITKLYITTSLIFEPEAYLVPFMDYLNGAEILSKVLICTSYDLKYRFHTDKKKSLWESNMIMLAKKYPDVMLHTETIVTSFFIDSVLDGSFKMDDFANEFKTTVDYIEPAIYYLNGKQMCCQEITDFLPTRAKFTEFCKKAINEKLVNLDTFLSREIRSNAIYVSANGVRRLMTNRRRSMEDNIGFSHGFTYNIGFCDSNMEMSKVFNQIKEML